MKFILYKASILMMSVVFAQAQKLDTIGHTEVSSAKKNALLAHDGSIHWVIFNTTNQCFEQWDGVSWQLIPTQTVLNNKVNKNTLQPTEQNHATILKATHFSLGNAPFNIDINSATNKGAGFGTYNHGTWFGYNAGRHSGSPVTAGKPAIIMGFEDNYFDWEGDLDYGTEWYVEGSSPNGTTVQMSRPYYARGFQKDNGHNAWTIWSDIGSSGANRSFTIKEGGKAKFQITPNGATFYNGTPVNIDGGLLSLRGANFVMDNDRSIQVKSSLGIPNTVFKVGKNNNVYFGDVFNGFAGDFFLRSGGLNALHLTKSGSVMAPNMTIANTHAIGKKAVLIKEFGDDAYLGKSATSTNSSALGGLAASQFLRSDVFSVQSHGGTRFNDNVSFTLGTLNNAQFFYNGTDLYTDLNTGNWHIRDGSSLRFTFGRSTGNFYASGNLGIGTQTPSEKLEVNGKIKATSINFSGLPTSEEGLSTGDVWNDSGILRIVL